MISLNNIPDDPEIRIYSSLAAASISFDIYYKNKNTDKPGITLRGANTETVKYLWTAFMMLGLTLGKEFDPAIITVYSFNPKDESGWFSFFSSNSLHDKVFLPLLGNTTVKLYDDELTKELGHQVPDNKPKLKQEVQQFLCQSLIKTYFTIKNKTISFNNTKDQTLHLLSKEIGIVKVAQALATVSEDIDTIKLSNAHIGALDEITLKKFLNAMPSTAEQLDLTFSNFSASFKGFEKLINTLRSIPANVYSLNLGDNELFKFDAEHLAKVVTSLPPSITHVNLEHNELYRLGAAGLIKVLSSLPTHITSVYLDDNDLHKLSGSEIAQVFRAIPSTVTCLSLNRLWPNLKHTSFEEAALALSGLHNQLKTLSLQDIEFHIRHDDDVEKAAKIVKNIPQSVTKLYLRGFASTNNITRYELFKYLPKHAITPDVNLIELAKKYQLENEIKLKEKEVKLKREKESRNEDLLYLAKKFDAKLEQVKALIDPGVNLDCQNSTNGYTPLMHALDAQNEKVAEYLLSQGANPLIKNKSGETARALVSRNASIYPVLKGYELLFATKAGDLNTIKLLLKTDNSIINFQGIGGYTALLLAIEQDMTKIVEFFLFNKPNLSLTCDNGKGPMELAKSEIIKQMLTAPNEPEKKEGQDKESKNKELLSLVEKFDVKLQEVKTLIDSGADINCQASTNGCTPLMLALDVPNERLAEYLLRQGANPLIKNKSGEIARHLVSSNASIYPILKGYELIFATLTRNLNTIKLLLKTDNSIINFQGPNGYTALLIAIEQNMTEIAAFLLSNNPDLSLTCDDGKGPIDLAKSEAIIQMLSSFYEPAEELDDNTSEGTATNENHSYGFFSKQESRTTDSPMETKFSI